MCGERDPCRIAINNLGTTAPSTLQSTNYWKMGKHGQKSYNHRMQLNCLLSVFFLFNQFSQENGNSKFSVHLYALAYISSLPEILMVFCSCALGQVGAAMGMQKSVSASLGTFFLFHPSFDHFFLSASLSFCIHAFSSFPTLSFVCKK